MPSTAHRITSRIDTDPPIATSECAHCGLPVPLALVRSDQVEQFCCGGCEAVYQILHDCDLEEYYRLRDSLSEGNQGPARVSGKDYSYFDDPEFLKKYAEPRAEGTLLVRLYLEGVHCIACAWLVEKVLMERENAGFARLDIGKSVIEIVFDPTKVSLSRLAGSLDSIGYAPHPIHEDSVDAAARREARGLLTRIGIAGASAGNIMLLAVSLYAGEYTGIAPEYANLFRWISLGLALPALLYSAQPFFKGAMAGLRHGMLHMDLPISLGILSAFSISLFSTIQARGEVYYDSLTILILLLLCGRMLLNRATRWAAGAGENLLALEPRTARVIEGAATREVPLSAVRPDDNLRILPGETIPVDGILLTDEALIGEAYLTGESAAVTKRAGEELFAGSTVEQQPVDMRATAVGETTRLSRLAEMMRVASSRRAPIVAAHDRIAGYFVAAVLGLALITGVTWMFIDPSRALWNAAALMVITCPCALGLGTPVALAVAMGRAARRGLFIKGADGVERLSKTQHVILDKTGTLTEGRLQILDTHYAAGLEFREQTQILSAVTELEKLSGHVIATAFADLPTVNVDIQGFKSTTGSGIEGTVDGAHFMVGSRAFMKSRAEPLPTNLAEAASAAVAKGVTAIYTARDSDVVAVFLLGDPLRKGAREAVREIAANHRTVEILSGDHPEVVSVIAGKIDVDKSAGHVSPEAKLKRVETLENSGVSVAMVGDGINDAAALSRATAGISVAGATEIARDAADVFISERGPRAVADLFGLSRRAMKVVHWNIGIALAYNVVGVSLAMAGLVSPLVAAILMPISSLTVLTIAVKG